MCRRGRLQLKRVINIIIIGVPVYIRVERKKYLGVFYRRFCFFFLTRCGPSFVWIVFLYIHKYHQCTCILINVNRPVKI